LLDVGMILNPRLAAVALAMACTPAAPTPKPESCNPGVPADAQHPITARAGSLAGDYELVQVQTQPNAGAVSVGRLHLVPLDSMRRVAATGAAARDLVGWLDTDREGGIPRPDAGSRDLDRPGAVLTGEHLRLGRADGVDAYVEHLTITAVAPEGFWGWWRAEPGWNVAPRTGSRTAPDPAGYFCARRMRS
jgi:hypothetical protein